MLIKELESLCLDVKVLDSDHNEIVIKELEDEDEDYERSSAATTDSAEETESAEAAVDVSDDMGDDFMSDDVFDFDDVPSFEDISLDDLDDKE